MHIHNIYIARSNLVSLSSLDAHLMGQVQVIDEDIIHGGFVNSTIHIPLLLLLLLLLLFLRKGMNVVHPFLSFQGSVALFSNHISWIRVDGRVRE